MTKRRYNLVLTEELFDEIVNLALEKNMTMVEVVRQCIKLGLIIDKMTAQDELFVRQGDQEYKLLLIW